MILAIRYQILLQYSSDSKPCVLKILPANYCAPRINSRFSANPMMAIDPGGGGYLNSEHLLAARMTMSGEESNSNAADRSVRPTLDSRGGCPYEGSLRGLAWSEGD